MAKSMSMGSIAFLVGLLISVVAGFIGGAGNAFIPVFTGIIAVIVAVLNIDVKETEMALLWVIATGVVGFGSLSAAFGGAIPQLGTLLTAVGAYLTMIAVAFLLVFGYKIFKG